MDKQLSLFPNLTAQFPSTRYQGSKAKLVDWIWEQLADLDFKTCLDAFGGTGAVSYRLKQENKQVTYNDLLQFNYQFGKALIENSSTTLKDVDPLLIYHPDYDYPDFIQRTFKDIYFTDEENAWIDYVITNLHQLKDPYQFALAFFALAQACIVKRPYNLFHRKNLYIRTAEVERSFGNKSSWDKPFDMWFRQFIQEANQAVFDNGQTNHAFNMDVLDIPGDYDLVYLDPPYITGKGVAVDYRDFYHFLEGLLIGDAWDSLIDKQSKHRRLKRVPSAWTDKHQIHAAFEAVFQRYQDSIIVISYRTDGIPSEAELIKLLKQYKSHVHVEYYGRYQYVLSKNTRSGEMLITG